jgi:hypothetical protein
MCFIVAITKHILPPVHHTPARLPQSKEVCLHGWEVILAVKQSGVKAKVLSVPLVAYETTLGCSIHPRPNQGY